MEKFIVPITARDDLNKRLERLAKKANTYGGSLVWVWGNETVVERSVYSVYDNETVETGTENVFGIEVEVSTDLIKKEGYTVIAGIDYHVMGDCIRLYTPVFFHH